MNPKAQKARVALSVATRKALMSQARKAWLAGNYDDARLLFRAMNIEKYANIPDEVVIRSAEHLRLI